MIDLITDNLDAIRKACEDHDVQTLWVFGSAVNGNWVEGKSDVDFLVDMGTDRTKVSRRFLGLVVQLENILDTRIDATLTTQVKSAWFAEELERTKTQLYEAKRSHVAA